MTIDSTMTTERDILLRQHRERSDKISTIMGEYLLKGWRMLGETCATCDTILLLDREGQLYCIGCSEIDGQQTNHSPPSPVVPAKNGGRLPNEASSDKQQTSASQEKRKTRDDTVTNEHVVSSIGMKAVMVPTPSSIPRLPSTQSFEIGPSTRLPVPVSALQDKLIFCISCLESCETAEEIQQWAGAIKGLSEAFVCLKKCSF